MSDTVGREQITIIHGKVIRVCDYPKEKDKQP